MGVDFVERAAPSFKRRWDRARIALATPTLFTRASPSICRTVAGQITEAIVLHVGEDVTVEREGGQLVARRGLDEVVRITCPPAEIVRALEMSCNVARGRIEEVHLLARVAEVSLC
jgi:hypothetical protein